MVIALLFLLPFLDSRPERDPRARPRVSAVVTLIVVAVSTLTWLGFRDKPRRPILPCGVRVRLPDSTSPRTSESARAVTRPEAPARI